MQVRNQRGHTGTDGQPDEHKSETRLQQGGEGGTTRFGMEDGDNTDVSATGGPVPDGPESEQSS
jgi:hypothetical protein